MRFSFSRARPIFGLDIGSSMVKMVQLSQQKSGYQLEKFGMRPLAPEMIVDGAVMDAGRVVETIKELLQEQHVKSTDVVVSISGHSVIVKKINLPLMTEEELEESIKWEAEQYIPFDLNDVNIDFHVLGTADTGDGQSQMSVLLVAAKKDKLTEYTSLVTEAGLTPVVVDVDAFAVENMFGVNYDWTESEAVALVNIGASVMNINILKNGTTGFTRDISIGGNRYTETIQKELGLGYEDAERAKRHEPVDGVTTDALQNVIDTVNGELAAEISRSIDYFKTTAAQESIDRVILCGGGATIQGLTSFLQERLGVAVELANPFSRIQFDPKRFDPEYLQRVAPLAAVGVGLATRRAGDR